MPDVIKKYFLTKPCSNCPFRNDGQAIELEPGRLDEIIKSLLENDMTGFPCHKTTYDDDNWEEDDDGNIKYVRSGREKECAGSMIFRLKRGHSSVVMRIAGCLDKLDWSVLQDQYDKVIE